MRWPFRYKYWVVWDYILHKSYVKRARSTFFFDFSTILLDGPFDSQEDAARSLHFWKHQDEEKRLAKK